MAVDLVDSSIRKYIKLISVTFGIDESKLEELINSANQGNNSDQENNILITYTKACSKRIVGSSNLFSITDENIWEQEYKKIMDPKYAKNIRNYSKTIHGKPCENPLVYVIPRERGGSSYKEINLEGSDCKNLFYAPVSKGYSMQDVSSFTMGPIVGEGLCLVNSAFSKSICIMHIEGGGKLDLKRKNFWKPSKNPPRKIDYINDTLINIDGNVVVIQEWLFENEHLWLEEWEKWRAAVALCSLGDFHWADSDTLTLAYRYKGKYIKFREWKKECYIRPSYNLLPKNHVFLFLQDILKKHKISIGLVHPKGRSNGKEKPITREYIRELFDSEDEMCCQPYVVAGRLLNVEI